MEQRSMAPPGGVVETLESVPPHVWRGLPEDMVLRRSGVQQNRIGVWASKLIPKGKKFGPFVGERKKRSQVTSNVYMWEVYFPAWGWMCVDATDPLKGNWLRYVNWARSTQEQNLFPLEINRAIYYKVLKPIGPGEELLVWYNGEDNPEIAAAIEEERTNSSSKKNSPRARRARRKLLERAKQGALKGAQEQKQACRKEPALTAMWESPDALGTKEEKTPPSSVQLVQEAVMSQELSEQEAQPSATVTEDSPQSYISVVVKEEEEKGEEEGEKQHCPPPQQNPQCPVEAEPMEAEEQSDPKSNGQVCDEETTEPVSVSPLSNPELDPEHDPEGEPQGSSSFPCQHCERHFTTKQGLERHTHIHVTANHHIHTFKCRYCGKCFGSQIGRRRHERRHENGSKKRLGALGGTATSLSPSVQTDSSSPDLVAPSGNFIIMGSQYAGEPQESTVSEKQGAVTEVERTFVLDENGESKELHPCKYCKKVFGTHTNMRRHQRRIHERHLLPKGVRRKGMLLPEGQPEKQIPAAAPEESPSSSPPPVYVPSGDVEDEGDQEEEYMVDISSNISENLSLYIDGKILSTSTVSNCEVIEVDSSSAALFGVDAVIISPDQLSQALKVETTTCTVKEIPGQSATKRRTATPPLPPKIKTELESEPILPSSTSSSSSSASSTSSLVGTLFTQPIETIAFQKEKNVYLSPKLKQLLQTQDSHKPTVALITDAHRLGPPLSVTTLPAGSGRFKRRTASPPNSPQHSPALKVEGMKSEAGVSFTLKVPKLESHCSSPAWSMSSKDDRDTMSPPGVDAFKVSALDWPASRSGGSSCNQQPLDLSNSVSKRSDGLNKGPGEVVLDLSMHRKSPAEAETKGAAAPQPLIKKRKPNTSMLEKVLMNEYAGVDIAGEEGPGVFSSPGTPQDTAAVTGPDTHSLSPEGLSSESTPPSASLHPPPPSLTPVPMHPPSPCTAALGSPTPPPPVLPTAPSPLPVSTSTDPQPVSSPTQSSLPVLSPKMSPRSLEMNNEELSAASEHDSNGSVPAVNSDIGNLGPDLKVPDTSLDPKEHTPFTDSPGSRVLLQTCLSSSSMGPEEQSSPSRALNYSSIDSLTVTHSSVVIECTVHVGSSQNVVSAPLTVLENHVQSPAGILVKEQELTPERKQSLSPPPPQSLDPPVLVASLPESAASMSSSVVISESPPPLVLPPPPIVSAVIKEEPQHKEEPTDTAVNPALAASSTPPSFADKTSDEEETQQDTFCKSFVCNVCDKPFRSIKELSRHITEHAQEWPFKCEFCVLLFGNAAALLEHRSTLHGVGKIYVCSTCSKEFAFLCNLQQHQRDLHPGQDCTHTEVENGKLRPQNYNDPARASAESSPSADSDTVSGRRASSNAQKDEEDIDDSTEELYTTIKIMASEGGKPKGPDVRLGINQHYPSFKPPPFPYHNRTPAGSVASATNFTTHNIPQTFSTAIRCTKCGKSFDNMPELHKHILACANASDKKRYTPKKNPIPLKQIAKPQNGVLSPAVSANAGQNAFRRMGQPKRLNFNQEPSVKMKLNALNKKKNQLVQKAISQRNKSATTAKKGSAVVEEEQEVHVCPHCSREFTYRGSLNKHVAVSCPMKPVSKRSKKGKGRSTPVTQENNGSLRRRTAESEAKQLGSKVVQKTLGKTRARSSAPVAGSAKLAQSSKGRMAVSSMRAKRPASFPAGAVPFSKKSKIVIKGNVQSQQQLQTLPLTSQAPPGGSSQRQLMRMQRGSKEVPVKKAAEVKSPPPKKEERFPVKVRERVGGPVTRSLQQASLAPPAESKGEEVANQEPREPQDPLLKLAG